MTKSLRKNSIVQQPYQRILVGVAGGSAAGKTTLCQNIFRQMAFDRNFKVQIISLDSFYKSVDKTQINIAQYNFDHPNALDFDLAYHTLLNLINTNHPVQIPQYSFIQHARLKETTPVGPANVIFFQGLLAFYDKRIRDLLTYKIFINCDDDLRLCRRIKRDTVERGRSVMSVLDQYIKFVKNGFRDFILPTIVYADIIIPGFRNNRVSVDFIVQNIKNMARRITFKQKAVKTKTFIFGQSQIYDLQCTGQYQNTVNLQQDSFLVFPTSNEHKKQLQFFLTSLLSQMFSVQYFHEIYMNQFVKILKAQLKQLISLKNLKIKDMQILSVYNIQEIIKLEDGPNVKIVFLPMAELENSKKILTDIKKYISLHPKSTFIILNAFCDMGVPSLIYRLKLSNVIMINLFVIANDKRFRQIMTNNLTASVNNFDWFIENHQIANNCVDNISKHFGILKRQENQIAIGCYNKQLSKQKQRLVQRKVDQTKQIVGIIKQINVFSQQHQNLCGFHALSTLLNLQAKKDILSKQIFIQTYHLLANINGNPDYKPLQRDQLPQILNSQLFQQHGNVGLLFFSFKYIINSEQQILILQNIIEKLKKGQETHIYIILGIHDHYVLTKVTKNQIFYYDSLNHSLTDLWNGTEHHLTQSYKQTESYKGYKKRQHNMKQALQIILTLINQDKTLFDILIQKRIQDVVESFNLIKNNQVQVQKWLVSQYPRPVIQSQLFKIMRQKKLFLSQKHKNMLHEWLQHQKIKQIFTQDQRKLF